MDARAMQIVLHLSDIDHVAVFCSDKKKIRLERLAGTSLKMEQAITV